MKITVTTLLRASFVIFSIAALSGCGQKGPLVLEQVPVDQTQAPLENSIDQIPLETPDEAASQEASEDAATTETE